MAQPLLKLWPNRCTTYGSTAAQPMAQSLLNLWPNRCSNCGTTSVQLMVQPLLNLWHNLCSTYGPTVAQPVAKLLLNLWNNGTRRPLIHSHIPSTNTQNEVKFIQAVEKFTLNYINKSGTLIPPPHANRF
jgi:hypothetical protein